MEKLLKNGRKRVVVELYSMEVKQEDENIPEELKCTLEKHYKVLNFLKVYFHIEIMNIK
jgi:hypothetical protein